MLGAIIGDIVGSRWEFNRTNDYNFELFSDKNSFTDDTICTIAVADALLKERDYGESIHEWCRRYPHPMGGYGGRFAKWVQSDNPQPYGSFGNGSAMRVSPVGWWFGDLKKLSEEAEKSAACTHNHPAGMLGAEVIAIAIHDCIELSKKMHVSRITKEDVQGALDGAIHYYKAIVDDVNMNIEDYRNKFDETCQGTVPVALAIVANSTSFEDAIRQAVSLGADADTLGAIVGSIAEPLWGIPRWMQLKALSYLPDEMKEIITRFHHWCNKIPPINIQDFCDKYIDFFENEFLKTRESQYKFFDSMEFPNECWNLGFEMDCGRSFDEAYGPDGWDIEKLESKLPSMNDIKIIGSGIFSNWRYFNHWSFGHAEEKDKKWFLTLFKHLKELTKED